MNLFEPFGRGLPGEIAPALDPAVGRVIPRPYSRLNGERDARRWRIFPAGAVRKPPLQRGRKGLRLGALKPGDQKAFRIFSSTASISPGPYCLAGQGTLNPSPVFRGMRWKWT
ncbi:MAG: hypothetical protein JG766_1280 [Desulfacinum sp.]|nr:hypothetical protein [Desulfacinum sp.]